MIDRAIAAAALATVVACAQPEPPQQNPATTPPTHANRSSATSPAPASVVADSHLQIRGTQFVRSGGDAFHWRGISAFRLIEMVAHGRQSEAAAYLDWAAAHDVTVVRVLTMAAHLFSLSPADGVRALPELLDMAARRRLHVEIVALADTEDMPVDIDAHVTAVGAIAARYPNALLEIANEPIHATQARRLHDPAEVARLSALVPDVVPVALGSAEENERFSAGEYATFHFPRDTGRGGWGWVAALADGARLEEQWNKPLVNDEQIGAAAASIPGRRDSEPGRFRAAALVTRLAGMGGTFHYEGGLQARIPEGRELECFNAWNEAWTLLPADIETAGAFKRAGDADASVDSSANDAALAVFERQRGNQAWVLVLDVRAEPALKWRAGWAPTDTRRLDRVWLISATRSD